VRTEWASAYGDRCLDNFTYIRAQGFAASFQTRGVRLRPIRAASHAIPPKSRSIERSEALAKDAELLSRSRLTKDYRDLGDEVRSHVYYDQNKAHRLMSTILYFAYGSNMLSGRLRYRVPSCRFQTIAHLSEHRLRFHKRSNDGSPKCNAYFSGNPTDGVYGVVCELLLSEKAELDRAEGLGLPRSPYPSRMRSVDPATVHGKRLNLPQEICPVSLRRLRAP
jgi:hypothetical protein